MSNLLPDSGARETYSTGAEREPRPVEKGRFDLIPPGPLLRVAVHYARGADKYAERGWERGMPMSRTLCSLEGHINAWKAGDSGEDHLAAVVWNALALMHHEDTPGLESMRDVPTRGAPSALAEMAALYGAQKSGQGAVNEAALLQARRSPPLQMATPARLQGLSIADLRRYRGELARGMGARIVEGK